MAEAKELGPEAEKIVSGYAWHPDARTALVNRSSALAAKYLNRAGISAENKEEVSVSAALLSIYWGHRRLATELGKLRELKERQEKERKEADARNADNRRA